MIDAGMNYLRIYQMMLLIGSEVSSKLERSKYSYISRWRAMPRCFGTYQLYGQDFFVAEIEEICVGNDTLPYEDYLACRDLNLMVEVFYNDDVFLEYLNLLRNYDISASRFIDRIRESIFAKKTPLINIWTEFREDQEKVLWLNKDELEEFLSSEDTQKKYLDGTYGRNELYKARVIAFFNNLEHLHNLVHDVTVDLLEEVGRSSDPIRDYLDELRIFSLLRKGSVLEVDKYVERTFKYDFVKLMADDFKGDPAEYLTEQGIGFKFYHTDVQADIISRYIASHGSSITGLTRLLLRGRTQRLYRTVEYVDQGIIEGNAVTDQIGHTSKMSLQNLET
jgi:hypothetical protein